ncbi:type I-F CRISPR-associated protein Csy2 [Verminephrobacter aporrectodeae]|uniref:type I-F CRISPR-associated protein Csy2 n=1 Tax=Verminephrobacter aporrectodeae TaxID=1110389 RepID=UPI0022448658|nr:type I-F CRISPR-associated protein Csy2 [Verminephrobacter aporrectodeae]MCW8175565.1 type I-F CRISPR-associated protein Csy2 [Verminephrobacter aporrectodeae subsp. tuberculatae]MCW8203118.1 type I-F CRISPR-associated protein Csy2 [Verminephrobacter aporrectodeae subsp. tuberculatae]
MKTQQPEAILVLPHLRVQNANAVSSPLTHGFPSITAFMGLMWALERKLAPGIPLHMQAVGVISHYHQEQVKQGFVRTFNLTRNPVDQHGDTAAIVEEGRIHLDITLVFAVAEKRMAGAPPRLVQGGEAQMQEWASAAGAILSQMRVAGGTLLPSRPAPGKRVRPWMAVLPEDHEARAEQFRRWRRQWLPGFALVGQDHLLSECLAKLRETNPDATLLDAWLHAARRNYEPVPSKEGEAAPADGKQLWADPLHGKGSGWTVPIPVGYAALSPRHLAGTVDNARNMGTPLRFVESIYSLGRWISPHHLSQPEELWWRAEIDEAKGLYRCRNGRAPAATDSEDNADWDDDDSYDYR